MNMKRLLLLRRAARVSRMHTMPSNYTQSDGEHTFGVLNVLFTVCESPSLRLVKAILWHDVPEAITGDVPATAKWFHVDLGTAIKKAESKIEEEFELGVALTTDERKLLKYCDIMELAIFSSEEIDSGNTKMAAVLRNCLGYAQRYGLTDVTPEALRLYDFIKTRAEKLYPPNLGEFSLNGWPDYDF